MNTHPTPNTRHPKPNQRNKHLSDISVSQLGPRRLEVRDPWGNALVVSEPSFPRAADGGEAEAATATATTTLTRGIESILLPCHPGASEGIADFYSRVLGARTRVVTGGASGGSGGEGGGGSGGGGDGDRVGSSPSSSAASSASSAAAAPQAEVVVGPGTRLVFKEVAALGRRSDAAVEALDSGWHVALYIADFSGPFSRVEAAGLIDNDHPFRDKCFSVGDALRNRQFRFRSLVGGGGELLYRLSHEVRSMHHPRFMRPLHFRRDG